MLTPPWFHSVPVHPFFKRPVVSIDNNALSDYLHRGKRDDEIVFVLESPLLLLKMSRQVIGEALTNPTMGIDKVPRTWDFVGELQRRGKVVLSGTTQMLPGQIAAYNELQKELCANCSHEDAFVIADGVVTRTPIFSREVRLKRAVVKALRNPRVRAFLGRTGLPDRYDRILVGPEPAEA